MIMIRIGVALVLWLGPTQLYAQEPMDTPVTDHDLELAKKLTNPVAALISVPFQGNADYGMGDTEDGSQYQLKLEPVIPIAMTRDWNLISRTILPITYQQDVMPQNDQGGLGDTLESLFASPEKPGPAGLFWGIGPAASIPTATDDALGAGKLSIGPTAALLRQDGGWTIGILARHLESVAGNDERDHVSQTYLQPFLHYTNSAKATLSLNTETTYDWEHEDWTIPLNLVANQLVRVNDVPVHIGAGPRVYLATPMGGADWGVRVSVTLLFPR
jgi:hypothetical protein